MGGKAVELTRALFARLDVEVSFRNVPWQRALTRIAEGSADIIPMITRTANRSRHIVFTKPVYTDQLLLVTAAGKGSTERCNWQQPEALRDRTIGLTRDYVYGPAWSALMKDRRFTTTRSNTDLTHLKQAVTGRVDLSLQYYSFLKSSLARTEVDQDALVICRPAISRTPLRFGISRRSPLAERMPEINQALKAMKEDGSYRALLGELYREP
jgi:polar amino acid transport system substrate-binding protein